LTTRDYLTVLNALEMQLRRHASPWGALDADGPTQALREGWERIALHLKEEHPEVLAPMPFWKKEQHIAPDILFPMKRPKRPQES
jgi:hypothetical protein